MDIDSFCGSTPDQFADNQLWNDLLVADSYKNRPVDNHDHDHQQQQQHDLPRQPSMLLDQEFLWLNTASSDCCSAAADSEALCLDCGPAASEHDHDHVHELHNLEEMMDNPIKQLSSCRNMLPPESDGEYLISMESDGEEVESESTDNFQVPELGMKFSSEEEAYKFYTTYAKRIGFKVRKGKVIRLSNGTIRKRYFYCSREGFKCSKEAATTTAKYHRKETRTGCPAMVQFTIENGKWDISCFIPEHNHELEGKSKLIVGSHINALEDHSTDKSRTEVEAEAEATNCVEFHDKNFTNLLHDEKTNCIQLVDGQNGVVVVEEDVLESEGEVADESMRRMHLYKSKLKRKAADVITKTLAVYNQLTWMRVEDYLNMALKRVEEVSTRDAAISSRIDQEEVSNICTMKSQSKRKKCENEAVSVGSVQIKSKSSSDCAITHQHLLKVTKGPRRAVSHSICIEENSQQSVFRSQRPPLPSQSASIQVRPDHVKSSFSVQECWKERSPHGTVTGKSIMAKMEEMEKEISKLRYEQHNIVTSLNKPQRSKTTALPGESGTTTYRR
ncbi:hypothetical protein QYF36_002064 [Acer negundo]|nr:hypothetical protein QYF36_002064 [Acer negundo]